MKKSLSAVLAQIELTTELFHDLADSPVLAQPWLRLFEFDVILRCVSSSCCFDDRPWYVSFNADFRLMSTGSDAMRYVAERSDALRQMFSLYR